MEQNKKERILQAAMDMIADGGFHKSPISVLAGKARVAVGTIYHYFETKEELIRELHTGSREVMGRVADLAVSSGGNYRKRFAAVWKALYVYSIQHPKEFRFLEQFQHSPFTSATRSSAHTDPLLRFMKEGVKDGHLRKLEPTLHSAFFYASVSTAVINQLESRKRKKNKEGDEIFGEMAWAAMRKG